MNQKELPDGEWRAFATAAFGGLTFVLTIVAIVIACFLLSGCTTTRYVEVPGPSHTDTVRITQQQRDSIHVHDSIFVSEHQRGDTVYVQTVKWHTAWRDRLVRDTFRLVSIDSIPYRVEVPVEVPAKLTYWQRLRMQTGDIALIALALLLGYGALRLWRRFN
jgi:hypothetical protein